jgi:outer membrane receptor protein involved in Fe transport
MSNCAGRLASRINAIAGLLLLLLACAVGQGQATQPDLTKVRLEDLMNIEVFTASKHLQAAGDAPSSVTVITADEIRDHGFRTLADILRTVRGFFVTYDRNYSSIGVRGFARPGDYNTRILLLVDGHRLNDNVYDEAMIGTEFPIDIDLVQRIEVIRGPVSSLYGSNALLGVINVITKRGQDIDGFELSSAASSFNTYQGRVSYGRKIQQLEFLVSGTFFNSLGHSQLFYPEFNSPLTNGGIASHADHSQVGGSIATISFRDFTLQGVYGTREKAIPTAPYGTVFNAPGTRTTDSHSYVDFRYEHTFANSWDVLARTFYDRYAYHGSYAYASPVDPAQISPNLDFADGKWWGTEFQVTKSVLGRNRITAGGEYRDNIRQDQTNYYLNPYLLVLKDKRKSFVGAVYAQDELTITKSLALNAGLRYDYYSTIQASTDPRAALIYRPREKTAFKLIYGEAFRVPNVYELYYYSSPNVSASVIRPEKIHSAELVWEQGLGSHFSLSTSAFYNTIDDLITQDPTSLTFGNFQKIKSSGLEEEVKGQLSGGLEGDASYSFQQTKDRVTGQLLSDSPRDLCKLSLSQPFLQRRIRVSLDAQYRSRIQSLTGGSVAPFSIVNLTLLGHRIGKKVDLSASFYNLMDKKYFDPPSGENFQQAIQQDGRTFRIAMTWHFDGR